MNKSYCKLFLLVLFLVIFLSGNIPVKAEETIRPEVRALWVDAFRDGFKTPAQVDKLIQDSVTANINTLIVQVRRRGDAYYNNTIEPRTEDPALLPGFDALQYLIDQAHAKNIEVHAWLNTLVAWNSTTPPADPNHVWNLHGPNAIGEANWVSYYRTYDKRKHRWSDNLCSSFFLDPGNPDALDYTTDVYLSVVKNYNIDGIHLDYSRYAGSAWGYNPTNVARYNARYGATGLPGPDDPRWAEWRREQTANLVRKIYLKSIAVKPNIKVSSAVITWGEGPVAESDWLKSRAYCEVFQDWHSWLQEGILDIAIPMNYFCGWKSNEQLWYNQWIEWEKNHQYGRQIVIGPGIFSQYIEDSLEQIRRAQGPSALGNYSAGVCLFTYGAAHLYSSEDYKEPASHKKLPRQPYQFIPEAQDWFYPLLSKEGGYTDPALKTYISTQPVFPAPAPIPDMPWKSQPETGYLTGSIVDSTGKKFDHYKVMVDGPLLPSPEPSNIKIIGTHRELYTDGSGWFGLTQLPPGNYRVAITAEDFSGNKLFKVRVQAGLVTVVNFEEVHEQESQVDNNPDLKESVGE